MENEKNIKVYSLNVNELEIHELANLTPKMSDEDYKRTKLSIERNGQEEPIKIYRGKVVDGRHRLKIFKELGLEKIDAININPNNSYEDIKEKVLNNWESRRHQTPTQKAIMAYKQFYERKMNGEKVTQGQISEQFGTTRRMLGRVKKLASLVSDDIIELLFNGGKINIGDDNKPHLTDSLETLIRYFEKNTEEILSKSIGSKNIDDFTDEEIIDIYEKINELKSIYSKRKLEKLAKILFADLKN